MRNDDGVTDEMAQGAKQRFNTWRGHDHCFGDAGEDRDERRDGAAGIDKCLKGADAFATQIFGRTDFGNAIVLGRTTGRFKVNDAKSDIAERCPHIVK